MAKKRNISYGGAAGGGPAARHGGAGGGRPGAGFDGAGIGGAMGEKPATLKDLLNPDTVSKLKAHADSMRADEARRREEQRAQAEAARKAEQKRRDNDFEYLLNNSHADWKKYK